MSEKKYNKNTFEVTLKLQVIYMGEDQSKYIDVDDIYKILEYYEEGRGDFHAEVIEHHLEQILLAARSYGVHREMREKYGSEMVKTNNGSYNVACKKAEEKIKELPDIYFKMYTPRVLEDDES